MHLKESFQTILSTDPTLKVVDIYTVKKPNEQRQCHLKADMVIPYTKATKTIDLINADDRYQIGINLNQFMDNPNIDFNHFSWDKFIDTPKDKNWVVINQSDGTQWLSINQEYDPLQFNADVHRAFELINTINSALRIMLEI